MCACVYVRVVCACVVCVDVTRRRVRVWMRVAGGFEDWDRGGAQVCACRESVRVVFKASEGLPPDLITRWFPSIHWRFIRAYVMHEHTYI